MQELERKARVLVKALVDAGHEAYFAGGCVRDRVMGLTPKDYDIATSARPEQVIKLFKKTVQVGAHFGVVMVLDGNDRFEVTTFRTDGKYSDGRHPDTVTFTSKEEDVKRRDFTINGMLYDPLKETLIDLVEGRRDIERKMLRCIGEPSQRFDEDKLRMLRAVRFAARFDYQIEEQTAKAIVAQAFDVSRVSAERIRDELEKMIVHASRVQAFTQLLETGLLAQILPEVAAMVGVEQPPEYHPEGDVWVHTLLLLKHLREPSLELAFAALLHDVGKPPTFRRASDRIRFDGHCELGTRMTEDILRRLRFSNQQIEIICELVAGHMTFMTVPHMRESTLKRFLRRPLLKEHLELHRVDCLASHENLEVYEFCVRKLAEFKAQDAADALRPKLLLNGDDLIRLGMKPGPDFKAMLDALETEQLEGRISKKTHAEAWVKQQITRASK